MKKRRITAFAAAVLLLASLLCACKKDGGKKPTGTGGGTESSGESRYTPDVPDGITFNDETFSVLGIDPALYLSTIVDFDYESPPEDVVQEAIYNRNRRIEDTYRIDFEHEYVPISMTLTALQTQFRAQEDDYQLIMLISREAFPAAIEGTALTPDSIPHVNIEQPWYLQKVNNALTISGTQLLAYTDESMNTYMQSVCVFFNTEIVKNNSLLTSPYEMVKNGTWTLDNFYKTSLDAKSDANGDGVYSPLDGDVYGVISEADMFWPAMWVGADSKTVTVDKSGTPEFTAPKDQKLLGILSGLNDALKNEGLFLNTEKFFGLKTTSAATREHSISRTAAACTGSEPSVISSFSARWRLTSVSFPFRSTTKIRLITFPAQSTAGSTSHPRPCRKPKGSALFSRLSAPNRKTMSSRHSLTAHLTTSTSAMRTRKQQGKCST